MLDAVLAQQTPGERDLGHVPLEHHAQPDVGPFVPIEGALDGLEGLLELELGKGLALRRAGRRKAGRDERRHATSRQHGAN
jgi:hypothetical protein